MTHATREELEAGLDHVRGAPAEAGTLELIARRPAEEQRELLEAGELDLRDGPGRGHVGRASELVDARRRPEPERPGDGDERARRGAGGDRATTASAGPRPATSSTSTST